MVFVMTPNLWIRKKIEEIEGNRSRRAGEIRRNPATSHWLFFAYVIAGSIEIQRVPVLAIELVRKAAVDGRRLRIFFTFLQISSPHGADSSFQTYRTEGHTETQKVNRSLDI